jgi:hypothetical protein
MHTGTGTTGFFFTVDPKPVSCAVTTVVTHCIDWVSVTENTGVTGTIVFTGTGVVVAVVSILTAGSNMSWGTFAVKTIAGCVASSTIVTVTWITFHCANRSHPRLRTFTFVAIWISCDPASPTIFAGVDLARLIFAVDSVEPRRAHATVSPTTPVLLA